MEISFPLAYCVFLPPLQVGQEWLLTAHRLRKPSFSWTRGLPCTNIQTGPLKVGRSHPQIPVRRNAPLLMFVYPPGPRRRRSNGQISRCSAFARFISVARSKISKSRQLQVGDDLVVSCLDACQDSVLQNGKWFQVHRTAG
jgi:hypothetical protein